MKKKFYKAFTLIEMLVVMAIMIILMGVGITGGRALIQRANRIAHANAAKQIYNAAFSYYGEKGVFPSQMQPGDLVNTSMSAGGLSDFLESFDGGSDATYYYFVSGDEQYVVVCVTNGGLSDSATVNEVVCEGNGFGQSDLGPSGNATIDEKTYTGLSTGDTIVTGWDLVDCPISSANYCDDWVKSASEFAGQGS